MKQVNAYYLHALLGPLTGGADIDAEVELYRTLDPDNENQVRAVIRDRLQPRFERFDSKSKALAKRSLAYYLSRDDSKFQRIFNSCLLPFDSPRDPKQFFVWLWREFFGPEEYRIHDLSDYHESNDVYVPYFRTLAPGEKDESEDCV